MAHKTARPAPSGTASSAAPKPAHVQASSEMARPRLELGTPRFSGTPERAGKDPKSPANRRVAGWAACGSIPVVAGSCPRLKDVAAPPRPFRPYPRRRSAHTACRGFDGGRTHDCHPADRDPHVALAAGFRGPPTGSWRPMIRPVAHWPSSSVLRRPARARAPTRLKATRSSGSASLSAPFSARSAS